ncbi:MAG: serine/threonine-protein kinase [Gemmatimonadaceae bacterium]
MGEAGDGAPTLVADRYRVSEVLGAGAWGIVYRALDLPNDREVALKILRVEFAGSASAERFRREIAILARLDHPNIVALYDSGEIDGAPWYAMSYVRGESLHERLAREKSLPIVDALNIARDVAVALAHAHASGVVHRDIKPGNILLENGRVVVADFGIARAISGAAREEWKSSSGFQIGTPGYMSPEQVAAEATIDGRSDIYSTGCVLYEMLAGEKPFSGSSPSALMARHVFDPVPRLNTVRRALPKSVEAVVYRALAKSPADRFGSAVEFAHVLDAVAKDPQVSVAQSPHKARRAVLAALAVAALASAVLLAGPAWERAADARAVAAADTARVAIFPFDRSGSIRARPDLEHSLREALVRWKGIDVVDPRVIAEAIGPSSDTAVQSSSARALALRLHAGRYIRVVLSHIGSAAVAHAMLFDVSSAESPLAEADAIVPDSEEDVREAFSRLANRLLFRTTDSAAFAESSVGTGSLPSRQAFLRGREALDRWDLDSADSAFAIAKRWDPHFPQAALWFALTRRWSNRDVATWQYAVVVADAGRMDLVEEDRERLDALKALVAGRHVEACTQWDDLTRRHPFSFANWYGAADCLAKDPLVRRDPRSPSGWQFRSGYHSALERYRRAVSLQPALLFSFRANEFEDVRRWLWTNGHDLRFGRSGGPSPGNFGAFPSWDGDTLAFVPFPLEILASSDPQLLRRLPRSVGSAIEHQRRLFRDISAEWRSSEPRSAAAAHSLALSLALLGDERAVDTLEMAKSLTADSIERQRLVLSEIWMRTQFATPSDIASLRYVRLLTDSLLRSLRSDAVDPEIAASVAALCGRAFDAVRLDRLDPTPPLLAAATPLSALARSLTLFAAFGGPEDSLRLLELRSDSTINVLIPAARRRAVREEMLGRALGMEFPVVRSSALSSGEFSDPPLLAAEAALLRADTASVLRILHGVQEARLAFALPDLGIDALYPESSLLSAIGREDEAIAWIDPTLRRLRVSPPLADPVAAASLVRAMALRAELADRVGDHRTAALWAAAVVELWADADDFLQPVVANMRRISRSATG